MIEFFKKLRQNSEKAADWVKADIHSKVSLILDCLITKLYTALEKSSESKEVTHKQIRCRLLKNYSANIYEESLGRSDFSSYHNFENI